MPQVPDYLGLVKQDKEEAQSAARLSGIQAQGRTPEAEAKAFNLSTLTGQPVGVVRNNIDYAEQVKSLDEWSNLGVTAPAITEWVRRNDATGLVSADLQPLSGIEKAWRAYTDTVFRSPLQGVTQAIGGGLSGTAELQRAANTFRVPETSPLFGAANFLLREFGTSSRDLQAQAFEAAGSVIEGAGRDLGVPEERRNFGTEVGSALGQIIGYVGFGALTGGTGVSLLGAGQGAEMQADRVDEQGGTDTERAQAVALGAAVTATTERLGFEWLMRALPKGVKEKLSARLADILMASGGEALQETVENIGHAAVEKLIYNDKAELFDWSQIGQEAGVAGVAAAIFRTALGIKRTRNQPKIEEEGKAQLDALVALANQTKLKELAPSKFAEMIKSLGESSISIPAEQVSALFQGAEATVAERINVPLDDYLTALATKGDVSIPLDHYLANLTDQHEALRPFIRVARESLSLSDQEEEEMARERASKLARDFVSESDQTVYDDVRQMLRETGKFQDSDVDAYARVIQSGFRALAAQTGMMPSELYSKYRLTIKARLPDALTSPNIQPQLDSLIDRLKRGEEITLPEDPSPEQAQLKYALDTLRTEITNRGIDLQKRTPEIRDMLLSDPAMAAVLDQPAQINSVMDLPVVNAGDIVDGRIVREQIPNQGSIDASFEKSTILPGVREIPLSMFDPQYVESIKSGILDERTKKLADEIRESGEINPLIVAVDADGLYILEGGHRFDALISSGAKSLPAMVVIDESDRTLGDEDVQALKTPEIRDRLIGESRDAVNAVLDQPAFHGSPHRFDKFTTKSIGTGEGAQAYGWGLYFAESKEVAKGYRERLEDVTFDPEMIVTYKNNIDGKAKTFVEKALRNHNGDKEKAIQGLRDSLESASEYMDDGWKSSMQDAIEAIDAADIEWKNDQPNYSGALYTVEIPEGDYLLWDKPLREQNENVLSAIKSRQAISPDETGDQFYKRLAKAYGSEGASRKLKDFGIRGIKYLDGPSRADGEGSYNYVIFDENDVEITNTFYQGEARAQISIEPGKFEIELFQNADLSSFLHESGHMFLEILADLAKTSPEIAADFQKALTWMGVKGDWSTMSLDQKRPHHEQFARGFEAYLFEGKAPSAELTGIFARFRRWLMAIYRQVKNLDVELNDEIRGVFDRMLATQEEIDQMRSTMRAEPIVADGSALGWSPERFQSYVKALQDAQEAEESAILTRALKEVEREKRAWWKEEFARVLKTVEQEMRAMPQWAAWEGIRGGEKLDKGWLLNRYGQGFLNENMRSKRLYEADGLDPDVVASKYGYDSGDALVQALVNLKPFDAVAKAEAQRRMEAEHGNMLTDGRLVAEAAKALHNNKRLGVLAVEMDALAKLAGEPAMTATETRLAAQMIVSRQRIRDLNPYSLLRAERKAANEALKLAGQKKWGQALAAKKRQVLNAHLYDETIKAQDRAEKMRRFIKKFERTTIRERLGKVGLLDQVEALLSQYDLRRVSNAKLDRASAIQQMQLLASNGGLLMPEELMVRLLQDSSRVVNWRELTVEQFAGLDDVLRQLDRQARNDYQMLVNGEKKVLDDIAQEIGDGIEANAPTGGMISRGQANAKESMGSTLRMWLNSWRRPSSIARIMDGQEWGPITRHIIVPLREAVVTKLEPMRRAAAEKIASIYQAHYSDAEMKAMSKRKFIPELRVSLSHFDLIALGQNWGNASNRKAVVDSSVFGDTEATEEQYAAALRNHLEAKDWAFIQDTWDYIDSFWPETRAALQRRKGIVPPKIEPEAFRIETKDGQTITVRGGYFPLKYDTRLEGKLRPGQVETDADEMFRKISAGTSVASTTKYGHAIERVGSGKRPVLLSINTWHSHIDNVVRDLSLSDAVLYIDKILRREPVQTAFKKTGNREALETLNLWLQDVAVGEIPPVGFEQISAMLRTNFTLAKIGFNLNTVILQVTGLPQSMVVVGKRAMWAGLKRYAKGPVSAVREAMDQSAFMSARYELNTFNKDIVQVAEYLNGRSTDTGDGIAGAMIAVARKLRISPRLASWAFAGIRITQMQVDAITWHAAYAKAVEQQVPDPVRYADSVVENAQTSGLFMDRAGLERGTTASHRRQVELIKIWTTLGSYMLAKGNIAAESIQRAKGVKGALSSAIDVTMLFLPEAILYALIKGQWPDEEDDDPVAWWLTKTVAEQGAATMPFVREIPSAIKGFGSGGPIGGAVGDVGKVYAQSAQGEVDLAAIKSYVSLFGTMTGLPSAQVNRIIDYAWRTSEGEETNPIEIIVGRQATR